MIDTAAVRAAVVAAGGSSLSADSYWPLLRSALAGIGYDSEPAQLAVAANSIAESQLTPVEERRSDFSIYEPGTSAGLVLGNVQVGDGARFKGRGFIQLTGRDNYRLYGQKVGVDLVAYPTRALEPLIAAKVAAVYLRDRGAFSAAARGDWASVRKAVQPGSDPAGMSRFLSALGRLQPKPAAPDATNVATPGAKPAGSSSSGVGCSMVFVAGMLGTLGAMFL